MNLNIVSDQVVKMNIAMLQLWEVLRPVLIATKAFLSLNSNIIFGVWRFITDEDNLGES